MLPFSSLLTQLPLILIGALYMLYLGFCAVNRTKEAPLADDTDKKEEAAENKYQVAATDFFTLVSLSQERDNDVFQPDNTFHFIVSYPEVTYHISVFEIINFHAAYCLFSRPPPATA